MDGEGGLLAVCLPGRHSAALIVDRKVLQRRSLREASEGCGLSKAGWLAAPMGLARLLPPATPQEKTLPGPKSRRGVGVVKEQEGWLSWPQARLQR